MTVGELTRHAAPGLETAELLPWQTAQWSILATRLREDRLAHALLLTGPDGIGKRHLAELLAQALVCGARQPVGLPCGVCRTCLLYAAGTHPDVLRIAPEDDSRDIRVHQIRALSESVAKTAQLGGYKAVLVVPAERMTLAAANALLKTLEEPAPRSVLLLVSARPSALPATIRSRCQRLGFRPPSREDALAWIAGRLPEGIDAQLCLGLARGAPLEALWLAQSGALQQREEALRRLLGVFRAQVDPLEAARAWSTQAPVDVLAAIRGWLADIARLKAAARPPALDHPAAQSELQLIAKRLNWAALFGFTRRVDEAYSALRGSANPNVLLLLEALMLLWARLGETARATSGPSATNAARD